VLHSSAGPPKCHGLNSKQKANCANKAIISPRFCPFSSERGYAVELTREALIANRSPWHLASRGPAWPISSP
jgi:hypothetical protein